MSRTDQVLCQLACALVCIVPVISHAQTPKRAPAQGAVTAAVAPAAIAPSKSAAPMALEAVKVLALSQADGRAVLGLPDGQMVAVKIGETLPRSQAVLKGVMPDKLILEEIDPVKHTSQVIWMHKSRGGVAGRVERLLAQVDPTPSRHAPVSRTVHVPAASGAGPDGAPGKR